MFKKDSERKDYPETDLKRRKKNDDSFFLRVFNCNADQGTYHKGFMEKGKKINITM